MNKFFMFFVLAFLSLNVCSACIPKAGSYRYTPPSFKLPSIIPLQERNMVPVPRPKNRSRENLHFPLYRRPVMDRRIDLML